MTLTLATCSLQRVPTAPAEERIRTDTLQRIADDLFDYQLELVNLGQGNIHASARLLMRNVETYEEIRIPLDDIDMRPLISFTTPNNSYAWIKLEPTEQAAFNTPTWDEIYTYPQHAAISIAHQWIFEINVKEEAITLLQHLYRVYLPRARVDYDFSPYLLKLYFYNFNQHDKSLTPSMKLHVSEFQESREWIFSMIDANDVILEDLAEFSSGSQADFTRVETTNHSGVYIITLNDQLLVNERRFKLDIKNEMLSEIN